MSIHPIDNRIIVRPFPAEMLRPSGIVLVAAENEKPLSGTVIAIGPGKINDDGTRDDMKVAEGDNVMFGKYAQQPFEFEGETLLAMCEMDVLFVMED